tara:strand:+ start:2846 stop:3217 length:372 start_codon:yes stop_codon:yes gene_type:complete
MENLFVYGSLKKGFGNHRVLENSQYVGVSETGYSYEMVDLGYFPGVIKNEVAPIFGEIYLVDEDTMQALDRLEGNGSFYNRQLIWLGGIFTAWMYFLVTRPEGGKMSPVNGRFVWEKEKNYVA